MAGLADEVYSVALHHDAGELVPGRHRTTCDLDVPARSVTTDRAAVTCGDCQDTLGDP